MALRVLRTRLTASESKNTAPNTAAPITTSKGVTPKLAAIIGGFDTVSPPKAYHSIHDVIADQQKQPGKNQYGHEKRIVPHHRVKCGCRQENGATYKKRNHAQCDRGKAALG